VTIAMAAREPSRSRRGSTNPPPATFFRALSISISICVVGFFDAFTSSSSRGVNSFRIRDTLVPMVLGAAVSVLDCDTRREGENKVRAISMAHRTVIRVLWPVSEDLVGDDDAWLLSITSTSVAIEAVPSLEGEMIDAAPTTCETSESADNPFVGLLILAILSDPTVGSAGLAKV
jgi:hypothetical protein